MKAHSLFSLLLCLGLALPGQAQEAERLSLGGQVRHRTEFDARHFAPGPDDVWFHLLRTRVHVRARPADDVQLFVQVQDARVWGGEDPARARGTMDGRAPALDLHQAYFRLNDVLTPGLSVQVGRQELVYGNERLVGAVGWSNVGRTFDAAVLSYAAERGRLDAFAARLVGSTGTAQGQSLYGLYGTYPLAPNHHADVLLLYDNDTTPVEGGPDAGKDRLARLTGGVYLHGRPGRFDYEVEAYFQTGKAPGGDGGRIDIRASLLSLAAGVRPDPEGRLRLGLLYTRLSGDDDPTDDRTETFNTLFATNHKFYGFMDFFPGRLNPPAGLQDAAFRLGFAAAPRWHLSADVHHFAMAADLPGKTTYGQEVDLTARHRYNDHVTLVGGASAFFPGGVLTQTGQDDTAYWLYLMTVVTF